MFSFFCRLFPKNVNLKSTVLTARNVSVEACIGYLAEVGVEVHHAVAELLHVLRQQLVRVGDPVVQVAHLVVRVAPVEAPV